MAERKRKKKKGPRLPRVTLIAYSANDLLRFTESMEKLTGLVNDLQIVTEALVRKTKTIRSKPDKLEGGG